MLTTPTNNVLVQVKRKYTQYISNILKVAQIQNLSTVDSANLVNIVGTVMALPEKITNDVWGYEGFSSKDIQVNDTAIFSSSVINDFTIPEDENAELIYKNRFFHKGIEYFAADIMDIFGVIRGNEIIMVNGYVMLDEPPERHIYIPLENKKIKESVKSEIIAIGNPLTTKKPINATVGDVVYYNSMKAAHYVMNGKKFVILPQHLILGKDKEKKSKKIENK